MQDWRWKCWLVSRQRRKRSWRASVSLLHLKRKNLLNIIVSSTFWPLTLMVSFKCINVTADAFLSLPHSKHKRSELAEGGLYFEAATETLLASMMQNKHKKKRRHLFFFPSVRTTSPDPAALSALTNSLLKHIGCKFMMITYIFFFFSRCAFHSLRGCVPSSGSCHSS